MVERMKGGVKLFVGRLPLEATQATMTAAFEEYGEVLEVFLIDSIRSGTGARCAFVRIDSLAHAERAIAEMHEQRVLVKDRTELGPIQVAFAKGEAIRLGLDERKEQLPSRWQLPGAAPSATASVDPDVLPKETLVNLVKEGQRTGGQAFKQQWWNYCDAGKGGCSDFDPKRHARSSLKDFFVAMQNSEWGQKPWFRRAVNWAVMGGKTNRSRGRRHASSSGSSSSSHSRSSSGSSKHRRNLRQKAELLRQGGAARAAAAGATEVTSHVLQGGVLAHAQLPNGTGRAAPLGELLRAGPPPPPEAPPPPEPEAKAVPSKPPRLLAPASERDPELESFLAQHRISPSTSFQMLKLTKEQAAAIISLVKQRLAGDTKPSHDAEGAVAQLLKSMGIRTSSAGGGSWTSMERTASPVPVRTREADVPPPVGAPGPPGGGNLLSSLPSVDGLLGSCLSDLTALVDDSEDDRADVVKTQGTIEDTTADSAGPSLKPPEEVSPQPAPPPAVPDRVEVKHRAQPGVTVFVKNLDKSTGERELRELFGRHGSVDRIEIPREKETGQGRGHAFVWMARAEEADKCIKAINFTKPWGRALIVERFLAEGEEAEADARTAAAAAAAAGRQADATEAKKGKPQGLRTRHGSSSASSDSGKSGWSRYTVGSKAKAKTKKAKEKERSRGGRDGREGRTAKDKGRRGRRRRTKSPSSSSSASSKSSSSSSYGDREEDKSSLSRCTSRSRRRRRKAASKPPMMEGMPPLPWPAGAQPFSMPGLPGMPHGMMPPPWAVPWGMPAPPMFDEGYPYDREDAERHLQRAEKQARKELDRRRKQVEKHKANEVWEDHPARLAHKKRDSSASGSSAREKSSGGSLGQAAKSEKAQKKEKRNKADKRRSSESSKRKSRRDKGTKAAAHAGTFQGGCWIPPSASSGGWPAPGNLMPAKMMPSSDAASDVVVIGAKTLPKAKAKAPSRAADDSDSDLDLVKVQEDVDFADI